jgi:hypothetical protein
MAHTEGAKAAGLSSPKNAAHDRGGLQTPHARHWVGFLQWRKPETEGARRTSLVADPFTRRGAT